MTDLIIAEKGYHASGRISISNLALKIIPVLKKSENLKCHGFDIFSIKFFIYPVFSINAVIKAKIKYIYSQGRKKGDYNKE